MSRRNTIPIVYLAFITRWRISLSCWSTELNGFQCLFWAVPYAKKRNIQKILTILKDAEAWSFHQSFVRLSSGRVYKRARKKNKDDSGTIFQLLFWTAWKSRAVFFVFNNCKKRTRCRNNLTVLQIEHQTGQWYQFWMWCGNVQERRDVSFLSFAWVSFVEERKKPGKFVSVGILHIKIKVTKTQKKIGCKVNSKNSIIVQALNHIYQMQAIYSPSIQIPNPKEQIHKSMSPHCKLTLFHPSTSIKKRQMRQYHAILKRPKALYLLSV